MLAFEKIFSEKKNSSHLLQFASDKCCGNSSDFFFRYRCSLFGCRKRKNREKLNESKTRQSKKKKKRSLRNILDD